MSVYCAEIEATAGPARVGLVGGGAQLLVRVTLYGHDPDDGELAPDAYCDLGPWDARHLALELLAATEDAERQTERAGYWKSQP